MWVYGLDWAGPGQGQVADALGYNVLTILK